MLQLNTNCAHVVVPDPKPELSHQTDSLAPSFRLCPSHSPCGAAGCAAGALCSGRGVPAGDALLGCSVALVVPGRGCRSLSLAQVRQLAAERGGSVSPRAGGWGDLPPSAALSPAWLGSARPHGRGPRGHSVGQRVPALGAALAWAADPMRRLWSCWGAGVPAEEHGDAPGAAVTPEHGAAFPRGAARPRAAVPRAAAERRSCCSFLDDSPLS